MSVVVLSLVACSPRSAPVTPGPPAAVPPAGPGAASRSAPTGLGDRGLEPPEPALRLPRNFAPTHYAARLAIDPASSGFDGSIAITGALAERSSVIWLHGHHLTVARAVATGAGGEVALSATPHGSELIEFRAAAPLAAGSWTLAIDYTGRYDEINTTGAFKQSVAGASYIYTQLEALYARWVFPCFDEPDSKVPWQLTLDIPTGLVAVSNTPIARETAIAAKTTRVEFAQTKPLPTYLIAFGVGPFDVIDAGATRSGTPVRLFAMHGRAREATWAARTTPRLVDLLEEFFGSPYPYEKIDMMAIPVTVGFGAMENAGLITFTETLMLIDPDRPAKQREYEWVFVAAHELSHQWFGDLVTTAWWNDIWLNEGFANWAERKISARFEPAWHEELSAIGQRNSALGNDSLVSAREIRQPIVSSDDILNAFDGITYDKGASVLNMFEGYLGHDAFLGGVRDYLRQHAFGNATSADFAQAISRAAGKDVTAAFATFLEQPGAPEIAATLQCERGQPARVAVHQQRYVPPGALAPAAGKPWIVPVCVAYDRAGKRGETCALLEAETGSIALDTASCPRWMMPNVGGRGYYRSAYTAEQVVALRDDAWPQLAPTERDVVLFDVSNAAMLGKLPFQLALSFSPKLLAAGDRFSIAAALQLPLRVKNFIPEELRTGYEAWLRRTFGPAARKAGLSPHGGESLDIETVRGDLIDAVAGIGREPVLSAQAVKLAEHWRDLPPAVRGEVIAIAADASPVVFDRLLADLHREPDRARRDELVKALSGVRSVARQRAALALSLDPTLDIRDTQGVFTSAADEANRAAAQQFVRDHKDALLERIPTAGTATGQAWLAFVFTSTCRPEQRDELADYVTTAFAKLPGGDRIVKQAIEDMDQCIARRRLIEPELRSWLAGGAPGPSTTAKAAK
jgi:alanyl aminopeptidase